MANSANTRFDGMHVHTVLGTKPAVYNVQGQYLYKVNGRSKAVYEIRGNCIHKASSSTCSHLVPQFEIKGNRVHTAHGVCQAIYEIR